MEALTETNVELGQLCSGLQYVWCIIDIFRTGDDLSTFVDTLDLWSLKYKEESHMYEFRAIWHYIVINMQTVMGQREMRRLLYSKLKKPRDLDLDLADYNRLRDDDPVKSVQLLINAMDRILVDRLRENKA